MAKRRYSKTELNKKLRDIREKLRMEVAPFEEDAPDKQKERIARARTDRIFFLHTYFPHYCTAPSPKYHHDLAALTEIENTPVGAVAPRGGAKSVIATFVSPLHDIVFELNHFIIIISDTKEVAADFAEFIKIELEENTRLRQDFGDLVGKRIWGKGDFVTANNRRVLARGYKTRVRGLRHGPHRPDRVILDDYEGDEEQYNPKRLEKKEKWIKEVVIPSLNPDRWYLTYIGTLLSSGSVLARFMDKDRSPEWVQRRFPAIRDDGSSFWPERFKLELLHKTRKRIGERAFNQEYMGIATDDETAIFREKWFKKSTISEQIEKIKFAVGYVDASAKSGESNDFKAQIILGWTGGNYVVLYAWIRHATTTQMMDESYRLKQHFPILSFGMEEVAFTTLFEQLYHMYGETKGFLLPLRFRTNLPNKEARIAGVAPLVEQGRFVFCTDGGDMDVLIDQLKYFPNTAVNDDGPDALEGAYWLAQELGARVAGGWSIEDIKTSGKKRVGHAMAY